LVAFTALTSPHALFGLLSKAPPSVLAWTAIHPAISLTGRSFNVLVAPIEHFIAMLNHNLNLQRYKVLFVTGNYTGILSRLQRRFTELEIRRGFTTFQLMTILEEVAHSLDARVLHRSVDRTHSSSFIVLSLDKSLR